LKVIHIPYCFYPDPIGGAEVYVEALARYLNQEGHQAIIAAPGESDSDYWHQGLHVYRYAISKDVSDPKELYGEGDRLAALSFGQILDKEKPSIVHLHAFTRGVSLRVVREAKIRRIPVVFTYHTPTVSCQRGTLMRWGRKVCDGKLRLHTCSRCTLHGLGMNKPTAFVVGSLPKAVGHYLGKCNLKGGVWTALRMSNLVDTRHEALRALMREVDHVVAVSEWVRDVLLINGVPAEKITLSRQGLCHEVSVFTRKDIREDRAESGLKVVFMGRISREKGLDVLIQAIKSDLNLKVTLDVYGTAQGESGRAYEKQILAQAQGDRRIRFRTPVESKDVVSTLRNYDILTVPSQWMESGPMVVLEAFTAGVPVIGSNLGGIAELVKHEVDGFLVHYNSVQEWLSSLRRLISERDLLMQLRKGVSQPKTAMTVVREMLGIYETILHKRD
jgi:glycosyltransferase involved in cell wall biosynthesis